MHVDHTLVREALAQGAEAHQRRQWVRMCRWAGLFDLADYLANEEPGSEPLGKRDLIVFQFAQFRALQLEWHRKLSSL